MTQHKHTTTPCCGVVSFCRATIAALAAVLMLSCSHKDEDPSDMLVKVGNATLTKADLSANMPGGLSKEDSINFTRAFIRSWINTQVISQFASKEVDMKEINKMVDQYRNELIMYEYTRRMSDGHVDPNIPEDTLKAYYDTHKEEFILTRPMVKGVYVKIADNAASLPKIRQLYRSKKADDIDKLEKSIIGEAIHYDYFRDKWVDWEQIESRIPYDFGSSADHFLKSNKNIDASINGFTYFLDINDVLHPGQMMPFESAKPMIKEKMMYKDRRLYGEKLKKDLYDNATASKKIKIYCNLGENDE